SILELQGMAGVAAGYGRTRGTGKCGQYRVVAYRDEAVARLCLDLAQEIVAAITADPLRTIDLDPRVAPIAQIAADNMLGPSTMALLDAAKRRRIPWFRLNGNSLVQLGHGRYARRI
ncbi:MAG TPA: cyanophycin synthetase, partial [Chloroflexia bacterium]|nr:cyanophycin synthetase [Chloroflexia bacterium]